MQAEASNKSIRLWLKKRLEKKNKLLEKLLGFFMAYGIEAIIPVQVIVMWKLYTRERTALKNVGILKPNLHFS